MMGPTKLKTIRAELRKAFNMSDAELAEWFDRQLDNRSRASASTNVELATLRSFRDALLREAQRGTSRQKSTRTRKRAKTGS
jgi:hypothetical protein